jgi:hypothetical protein
MVLVAYCWIEIVVAGRLRGGTHAFVLALILYLRFQAILQLLSLYVLTT